MIKLDICEIFYSLQGESTFQGMPCIFIRLAGCNLRCAWCDTQYSHAKGNPRSIASILKEIAQYPCKLVELTGGEPLWQEASIPLMETLLEQGYRVLLETNGSLDLSEVPPDVVKIVDVKCPGSGMGDSFMKHNLLCMNDQDEIKFVLSNYLDYTFAKAFLSEHQISPRTVHFSPVPSLLNAESLATWILEDGLNVKLSLQLHKMLNLR